jgi:hypothetical protein
MIQALTVRAANNLETLAAASLPATDDLEGFGRLTIQLVTRTIEELASDRLPALLAAETP